MRNFYLVAVNCAQGNLRIEQVHNFIIHCRLFSRWWNYLPFVWIVESEATAQQIAAAIQPTLNQSHFLVTKIEAHSSEGWLPGVAWDWFDELPEPEKTNRLRITKN